MRGRCAINCGLGSLMHASSTLDSQLAAVIDMFEAGQLDRALQLAQRLCDSHPDVAIVHNVLGVIAAEQGALQAAIDSYRRALALEPDNCDVHFNLGNALRDKGDLDAALASYRCALQIRPHDPDMVFNLAVVLRAR
jgi:protein O-GlcNAc transferase